MVEIKNLSQLKKALQVGRTFTITNHYIKPNYSGLRVVNKVQTNGIYSKFPEKSEEDPINDVNYGKGMWLSFGTAKDWIFKDGVCSLTSTYNGVTKPILDLIVND